MIAAGIRMVRKVLAAVAQMALLSFVEGVAEEVKFLADRDRETRREGLLPERL